MTIAIIGGGLAGATVATELRERGHDGPLVIYAGEKQLPYERPPLSKGVLLGNDELDSVSRIVAQYFWPREVSVLKVSYQKMLDETPGQNDYKHLVGWKRIKTKTE